MKNPEVQREIERKLSKRLDKIEVTQEYVLGELNAIIEAAKEAGAGHWQMQARLKATELLGKHLKMFTEKIEVGPNDALMELLLEGRKRAGMPVSGELLRGSPIPPVIALQSCESGLSLTFGTHPVAVKRWEPRSMLRMISWKFCRG